MRRISVLAATIAVVAATAVGGSAVASPGDTDGVQPEVSSSLVVNEVATRGPSGVLDEFIEVSNVSNQSIELSNFEIRVYTPANQRLETISFPPGLVLDAKGSVNAMLVLTAPGFSGTVETGVQVVPYVLPGLVGIPDTGGLAIFTIAGAKIDGVAFSTAVTQAREGQAARPQTSVGSLDPLLGIASARDVLSTDSDNNLRDFSLHVRTPGALN